MKAIALFALFLVANSQYLSDTKSATITYYTTAKSEDVACQLGSAIGTGFYRAAASEYFYMNSAQCGVCYELTGKLGKIKVQITDKCPADSAHCGDRNKVHFDLDVDGFPYLCPKTDGICDVTYKMIECDISGGVAAKIKTGVRNYFLKLFIFRVTNGGLLIISPDLISELKKYMQLSMEKITQPQETNGTSGSLMELQPFLDHTQLKLNQLPDPL